MVDVVAIGAINWDITLSVKKYAREDEEVEVAMIWRTPGGTGANVAVAAARILGRNRSALIGALGSDGIAREQIQDLRREGVGVSALKSVKGESGQAYIIVDNRGSNIIHTLLAANRRLTPADLRSKRKRDLIRDSKVVVITDPPPQTADAAIKIASQAGKIIVWDPGVFVSLGLGKLQQLAEMVNYFVLSAPEAVSLLGDVNSRVISQNFSCSVIVKQGAQGALLADRYRIPYVVDAVPLEALGQKVVNTVGCGDAFLGAFASFKALGYGDQVSLKRANCAGAFKATRLETRGSPTRAQLEALYRGGGRSLKVTVLG